jgi:aspartokinase
MTVADMVRAYLNSRPYTIIALESGVVNYSALSRLIGEDLGIEDLGAIKAGVRRYAKLLLASKSDTESRVRDVFRDNRITLLDGVAVVISRNKINMKNNAEVRLEDYYAYFTDTKIAMGLSKKEKRGIIKIRHSCSALIMYSGNHFENTIGALAFLTSVLASRSINIVETISCYDETVFVVDRKDALRSYELLSEVTRSH